MNREDFTEEVGVGGGDRALERQPGVSRWTEERRHQQRQSPRGVEQQVCLEKSGSSDVAVWWAGAQPRTMAGKDPGETGKSGLGRAHVPG